VKVRFTPTARAQFLSALSYIRLDKPSAATNFRQHSETVLRRLEDFPESGRIIPEFPELPYREVIMVENPIVLRMNVSRIWASTTGAVTSRIGSCAKKIVPSGKA